MGSSTRSPVLRDGRLACAASAVVLAGAIASAACGSDESSPGLTPCVTAANCVPGHACQEGTCATTCDTALCGARQECISPTGRCQPVACGEETPCLGDGELCDAAVFACFPSNGACSATSPCAPLPAEMSTSATVSCEGGFCRIKPIPLGQIAGLDSASVVAVDSPIAGQAFPTPTDVVFEWHGPADAASIVVILDQMVAYDSEIQYHAIWGAVRGALRNGRLGSRTGT